MSPLFYGILIMSVIGLIMMGVDKRRAKMGRWRISEASLWTVAILGGAPGMWLGMSLFRHKTKHTSFRFGLPILTLLVVLGFIYVS
ncbi:DUF1294 domain-containing protein [Aquisalibacillus elongatus]|uniref:Uncharacterized membrane protein YsdA (DUF1294 family) n=1 Tax=Aquisalibacillus elongatus TaxID=485577 RepID=A0A3N5BJE5_9BACI|nr:DUF1294 domain-containing protein [Aquisalibacillus elongatus]RPF55410.1 uncharacterized membrane protein YsdA (DUF1294 family) [Aquisalibacillus elongatus]